jgi:hypothetical protein
VGLIHLTEICIIVPLLTLPSAALVYTVLSQHRTSDVGIASIFCSYTERDNVTATTLFGSIVRQLLERKPTVPKNITDLFESVQGRALTHGEYLLVGQGLARSFRAVHILVDAIDECSDSVRKQLLSSLVDLGPNVGLFVTSRPDIGTVLSDAVVTTFEGNTNDFKAYLDYHMLREEFIRRYTANHPALHVLVRDTIAEKANGM